MGHKIVDCPYAQRKSKDDHPLGCSAHGTQRAQVGAKGGVVIFFPKCPKCGKNHGGICRRGLGGCLGCGKMGHQIFKFLIWLKKVRKGVFQVKCFNKASARCLNLRRRFIWKPIR